MFHGPLSMIYLWQVCESFDFLISGSRFVALFVFVSNSAHYRIYRHTNLGGADYGQKPNLNPIFPISGSVLSSGERRGKEGQRDKGTEKTKMSTTWGDSSI